MQAVISGGVSNTGEQARTPLNAGSEFMQKCYAFGLSRSFYDGTGEGGIRFNGPAVALRDECDIVIPQWPHRRKRSLSSRLPRCT